MSKMFKVIDSSATVDNQTRIHDVLVNGVLQRTTFHYGSPTELPPEVALKFLKDGFIVLDETGKPYQTPAVADAVMESRLKPGEVIARLEELELDALRLRAAVMPHGETVKDAKKEAVIAFLLKDQKPVAAAVAGSIEMDDEDGLVGGENLSSAPLTSAEQAKIESGVDPVMVAAGNTAVAPKTGAVSFNE